MLIDFTLIIVGYLLGSIPSAFVVAKLAKGIDIRDYGSKSTTGANAARVLGLKLGITAGVMDILKGVFAALIAVLVTNSEMYEESDAFFNEKNVLIALTGFAAMVGHCYSIYLKFSGGKGAATLLGVLIIFSPWTALIVTIISLTVLRITKMTSFVNLFGVWIILFCLMFIHDFEFGYTLFGSITIPFIYYTHRNNIRSLLRGEERKFGKRVKIDEEETSEEE